MKITIEIDTQNIVELTEAVVLMTSFSAKLANPLGNIPKEAVEEETIPTPKKTKPKPKKDVEKPVEKSKITLSDLKELAKNKVASSDRETVKKIIANYANKLAEVSEEDFEKLAEVLK